jgi:thiol-disulfide isomerase/thioredoxin
MNSRLSSSSAVLALLAAVALATIGPTMGCGRDEVARAEPPPKAALPVDLLPAPTGDVQAIVQREAQRAKDEGRKLLVYVGATWCEPCQRFHEAARAGKLDALFPGLRLLEFDLDKDRDRLEAAGYRSKLIPLFALPRADGVASGEQIEGSIKGPGAVDQIAPRLKALIAH